MKRLSLLAAALLLCSSTARADGIGFVGNPTGNSVDFASFVASLGQSITTLDFETHPFSVLQPDFYAPLGVRLTTTSTVPVANVFGPGPGQANPDTPPTSSGEGLHPDSRFLFFYPNPSTLTVSFASPVSAVGLSLIDLYNPDLLPPRNAVSIEAFTGPNGTGTSLGSFDAAHFNFQRNFTYFMGVGSSAGDIGSLVWRDPVGFSDDYVGIDDIQFASATPEPATLLLVGGGMLGLASRRSKKRRFSLSN